MTIYLKVLNNTLTPYRDVDKKLIATLTNNAIYSLNLKKENERTIQQNRALHLWFRQIAFCLEAEELYWTGISGVKFKYTPQMVKDNIFKPLLKNLCGKTTTTKMTKKDIDKMIDNITLAMAKYNVELPEFPNRELWDEKQKEIK